MLAAGRGKNQPLIPDADGHRLDEDFQRYPMERMVKEHDLQEGTTMYAVRRGAITYAVENDLTDLLTLSIMADVDPKIMAEHYLKRKSKLGRMLPQEPDGQTLRVVGQN